LCVAGAHDAGMPTTNWVVVLLLVIVIILLVVNTVHIRWLRRNAIERERRDEAIETQVRQLLARCEQQPAWKDDRPRYRALWVVPPAVVVALTLAGGWLRHNSGPIGATFAGVAAITALVIAGSSSSDTHPAAPPPTPATVVPPTTTMPRWPSVTLEAPPPGPDARPQGRRIPRPAPSTVATTLGIDAPTTTTTLTTNPHTTTTTTTTTPQRCLLRVELTELVDVCVPALS
jgi:hypothetical protein